MSETTIEAPIEPTTPAKPKQHRRANKRRARARPAAKPPAAAVEPKPVKGGEFAGVSSINCCTACTADHCVISTVGICKHPYKSADNGCGPITMANREKVRKLIKHQIIDLRG